MPTDDDTWEHMRLLSREVYRNMTTTNHITIGGGARTYRIIEGDIQLIDEYDTPIDETESTETENEGEEKKMLNTYDLVYNLYRQYASTFIEDTNQFNQITSSYMSWGAIKSDNPKFKALIDPSNNFLPENRISVELFKRLGIYANALNVLDKSEVINRLSIKQKEYLDKVDHILDFDLYKLTLSSDNGEYYHGLEPHQLNQKYLLKMGWGEGNEHFIFAQKKQAINWIKKRIDTLIKYSDNNNYYNNRTDLNNLFNNTEDIYNSDKEYIRNIIEKYKEDVVTVKEINIKENFDFDSKHIVHREIDGSYLNVRLKLDGVTELLISGHFCNPDSSRETGENVYKINNHNYVITRIKLIDALEDLSYTLGGIASPIKNEGLQTIEYFDTPLDDTFAYGNTGKRTTVFMSSDKIIVKQVPLSGESIFYSYQNGHRYINFIIDGKEAYNSYFTDDGCPTSILSHSEINENYNKNIYGHRVRLSNLEAINWRLVWLNDLQTYVHPNDPRILMQQVYYDYTYKTYQIATLEDMDIEECHQTHMPISTDHGYTHYQGEIVSQHWFDNNCFECDSCGEEGLQDGDDYGGDGYCRRCYHGDSESFEDELSCYSYDPYERNGWYNSTGTRMPWNNEPNDPNSIVDKPVLGLELEVIPTSPYDDREEIRELIRNINGHESRIGRCCSDGSLDEESGFEIKTVPMHKNFVKKGIHTLLSQFNPTYLNQTEHSYAAGIHIHINRSVLSELQIKKIAYFMYNNTNHPFINKVARRDLVCHGYARIDRDARRSTYLQENGIRMNKRKKILMNDERYSGLNMGKCTTLEFRIFQASVKYEIICSYIDFVLALCDFTSNTSMNDIQSLEYKKFLEWMIDPSLPNRKEYPHLLQQLIKEKLILPMRGSRKLEVVGL